MNKTQKEAWVNLICMLFNMGIIASLFVSLFIIRRFPNAFDAFCVIAFGIIMVVGSFIFIRKKQSPKEVDSDERDSLLKKRAVMISYVSGWLLLAAASVIPRFIVGQDGWIPVWSLPFINIIVFLLALSIYNIAVLIQYRRGGQ